MVGREPPATRECQKNEWAPLPYIKLYTSCSNSLSQRPRARVLTLIGILISFAGGEGQGEEACLVLLKFKRAVRTGCFSRGCFATSYILSYPAVGMVYNMCTQTTAITYIMRGIHTVSLVGLVSGRYQIQVAVQKSTKKNLTMMIVYIVYSVYHGRCLLASSVDF